ncbi:MAG: hypothetical protein Q8Q09_22590 [Deltaproteobacteria bacterium]|nr:hypothetical protein [Deltaproteobacteria bacterium]
MSRNLLISRAMAPSQLIALATTLALSQACSRPLEDDLANLNDVTTTDATMETSVITPEAGPMCPPDDASGNYDRCATGCADLDTDRLNCGRCDRRCAPDETCQVGRCVFTCAGGLVECNARCIDPRTSPDFCGASANCLGANVGRACMGGRSCVNGVCQFVCPAGQRSCDGNCVDPMTHRMFCGATGDCTGMTRGSVCAAGQDCVAGACGCPAGSVSCNGVCVDPNSSATNCGASGTCMGANAGTACAAGSFCAGGSCVTSCGSGTILCGATCIAPSTSRTHCGASGTCMGPNAGRACTNAEVCIDGSCRYFEPPQSYASPGIEDSFGAVYGAPRPMRVSVGSFSNGTIFYTCDNSIPGGTVGGSTRSAANALQIEVGTPACPTLRWVADYGAPLGRERAIHGQSVVVTPPDNSQSMSQIIDNVRINGRGPVARVAPGARVVIDLDQQWWHSSSGGYCPGCIVQASLSIDSDVASGYRSLACENYGGGFPYPGRTAQRHYEFNAPTRPGRYAIRNNINLAFSCAGPMQNLAYPGGAPVGYLVVQ